MWLAGDLRLLQAQLFFLIYFFQTKELSLPNLSSSWSVMNDTG
jgi:hypothetical protein